MEIRTKKYAELAYPLVENIQNTDLETKYRTLALNFPTMILQSGLVQAIGFLMAKNENHHITLLNHLKTVLNQPNLYDDVLNSDIVQYQQFTRNAIEASSWIKRYTQALLEKERNDDKSNEK